MQYPPSPSVDSSLRRWRRPAKLPTLQGDQVHVWRVPLEFSPTGVNWLSQVLSKDERDRADRFHFDSDRNHFIVARAWLRIIIGSYLRVKPADLEFDYSNYGKPSLAKPFAEVTGLNFNLAHSGELAVFGMTLGRQIGIDLERISCKLTYEELAQRFFSSSEIARLSSLPQAARRRAFFDCWTRKEAFIKAKGLGLSLALDQFDVALGADEPALLCTRWDQSEADRWSLRALDVDPDYVGALAVEGKASQLSYWQVDEKMIGRQLLEGDGFRPWANGNSPPSGFAH
jgi:4'-phosphopantetheinyl transferase